MMRETWMEAVVPPPPLVDHIASQNSGLPVAARVWTRDEKCRFEQALAGLDLARPDWEKVARAIPGRTVREVVSYFKSLEVQVSELELGLLPVLHRHPCQTLVAEESTPNSLGYLCWSGQNQTLVAEESTQGQRNQPQRQGRRLRPRSKVWMHFTRDTSDSGKEIAKCKRCGKEYAYHGTKNLLEHLQQCDGQEPADVGAEQSPQPQPLLPPACAPSGSSGASKGREPNLDDEETRRDLGRMIAMSGYEPSVVEDLMLPSQEATIGEMGHDIHMVSNHISSFALGKATFTEAGKVLYYMTDNFIDHEWNLCRVVEDAYVILPLGDIHYHLPFWRVPVVSPHDAVRRVTSKIVPYLHGPCMIVVGITGDIHHIKVKNRLEEESRYVSLSRYMELPFTTYMDHVLHSIARCLLPDSDFSKHVFSKIKSLGWTEARDQQILLSQLGLNEPWEYDERWYWCYCSLEILSQQIPIQDEDSESEKLLRNLWREIYRAIRRVSVSNTPTSNLCLDELFKVRHALQWQLSRITIVHADTYRGFGDKNIAGVLIVALETVDEAIEDSYLVWSIPLILDPRYKLSYIKERFEEVYDDSKAANYTTNVTTKIKELCTSCIKGDGCTEAMVELSCYLEDSPTLQIEGFDVLNWWKVHGSVKYPRVAQMARYALAMPTCSNVASDQIAHLRSLHMSESDCPGAKRKKV